MTNPNKVSQKLFLGSAVASVAFSSAAPISAGAYAITPNAKKSNLDTKHTLNFGSRGDTVSHLQSKLNERNLYKDKIDGVYGPSTQTAVVRYQKEKGLRVDGKAGPKTRSSLSSANGNYVPSDKIIQEGDHGQSVRSVQKKLKHLKNNTYSIDGKFGQRTKEAVKEFQSDNGLQVDGIVGSQTRAALYSQEQAASKESANSTLKLKVTDVHTSANNSGLVADAKNLEGTPYQWGGNTPGGFDCSGYIKYVFKKHGIHLPRSVSEIWNYGVPVQQPQKGDLVFFETYKAGPSHVGIYAGNGNFLSATNDGVTTGDMSLDYWQSRYLGAKRITQTH